MVIKWIVIFGSFLQLTSENFLTQPNNVTIEVGDPVVIDCKLEGVNDRKWYINGSLTSESNLPVGTFSLQSGLYIAEEYSKSYNQTTFQCSYSTYVGPPTFIETFFSSVGKLTVLIPNNGLSGLLYSVESPVSLCVETTNSLIIATQSIHDHDHNGFVLSQNVITSMKYSYSGELELSLLITDIWSINSYAETDGASNSTAVTSTTISNDTPKTNTQVANMIIVVTSLVSVLIVLIVITLSVALIVSKKYKKDKDEEKEVSITINHNEAYDYIHKNQIQQNNNVAYNYVYIHKNLS